MSGLWLPVLLAAVAAEGEPPRDAAAVERFCSSHHRLPLPDIFERRVWIKEIDRMYAMSGVSAEGDAATPPREVSLAHFQSRAPERIAPVRGQGQLGPGSFRFRKRIVKAPGPIPAPAISDLRLERVTDLKRPDLLWTDMRQGLLGILRPSVEGLPMVRLAEVPFPGSVASVDLDRDQTVDLLVSDLGSFEPADHDRGRLLWLRGRAGKGFEPQTLLDHQGRIAETNTGDLDGDGDIDIAVASFGWRASGGLLYLQNRTTDWSRPRFLPVTLDPRSGALTARIVDIDQDQRLDIVVLYAQQHESLEAFLNHGPTEPWERRVLWAAPHPAWGHSRLELVDLDRDGDLDALVAAGDTLDHSQLVPWQGVRWYENLGGLQFRERLFAQLPGCHAIKACDLDGDGDLDIVAAAWMPQFPADRARIPLQLESIIWLEQIAPGEFERHSIESLTPDYAALETGDYDGDGDVDLFLGGFALDPKILGPVEAWITVFENLTR